MGKDRTIGQRLLLAAGFLAATGFFCVSLFANLKFGLSLGSTAVDKTIFGTASLAADLVKASLPLLVTALWTLRRRCFALAGCLLLVGAVVFSFSAAVGFAATSRGEMIASRTLVSESRATGQNKIRRIEQHLNKLGVYRPASVIQAEINGLLRTPGAEDCSKINGPVTRKICPQVDRLRKELSASGEAVKLEAELGAARSQLATLPVNGLVNDPQSVTLSRLTGHDEAVIRDALVLLLALLTEAGAALSPALVVFAVRSSKAGEKQLGMRTFSLPRTGAYGTWRAKTSAEMDRGRKISGGRAKALLPETANDAVECWALSRLDILASGMISAKDAYRDFGAWCRDAGTHPCKQARFGRRFTQIHAAWGGQKIKRRDGVYYSGVVLQGELTSVPV